MRYAGGVQRMILNGEDVTDLIRTPEVSMAASEVSAIPAVRAFLLDTQRDMAKKYNVIMDGRDIGTVVLPDARLRDRNDSSRDIAPLRPAPDAVMCDTTEHDLEASFALIRRIIRERI